MIYKVLSLYYLPLFPPLASVSLPEWLLKSLLLAGDFVFVFIREKENWQCFSRLSTMLWSRAVMYPERGTLLTVSRSGYIWFQSTPRDQESTIGSPCLVEWKSRNITMLDVTCCVRLHTLLHAVACCCAKFETGQTPRANGRNNSQHCFFLFLHFNNFHFVLQ